jgi:hypothetical protein
MVRVCAADVANIRVLSLKGKHRALSHGKTSGGCGCVALRQDSIALIRVVNLLFVASC